MAGKNIKVERNKITPPRSKKTKTKTKNNNNTVCAF